jgi:PAS domain S-box-containing protein
MQPILISIGNTEVALQNLKNLLDTLQTPLREQSSFVICKTLDDSLQTFWQEILCLHTDFKLQTVNDEVWAEPLTIYLPTSSNELWVKGARVLCKTHLEIGGDFLESRNANIISSIQSGVIIQDLTGKIVFSNASAERILGLSYEQMIGKTSIDPSWRAIKEDGSPFPGEEHPAMQTLKTGKSLQNVIMGVHKPNGELTWINVCSQLLFREYKKQPYAVLATFEDITAYKKLDLKQKETQYLYSQILDSLQDLVFCKDKNLQLVYANKAFCDFYGKTLEELKGLVDVEHNKPEYTAIYHKDDLEVLQTGKIVENTLEPNLRFNGNLHYFHTIKAPIRNISGEVLQVVGVSRDITAKTNTQETLDETLQILHTINKIQQDFIAQDNPKENFEELLSQVLQITKSEYGFIGEVLYEQTEPYLKTHAITNIAWSEETHKFYEENAPAGLEFRNLKTLFGAVMTEKKPILTNEPQKHPKSGGIPKGHPPLNAFLGVPIFTRGQMVGMIGLANRKQGYDEGIVEKISPILTTIGQFIDALRIEKQRKKVAEELAHTKDVLEQANQMTKVGVWELDLITNTPTWSDICRNIFEVPQDYVPDVETAISFFKEGISRQTIRKVVENTIAEGGSWNLELQLITAKGKEIWVHTLGNTKRQDGKIVKLYGTIQDITERKNAEIQLITKNEELAATEEELKANIEELNYAKDKIKESEAKLKAIMDSSSSSSVLIAPDLTILSFNKIASEYTHKLYGKELQVGRSILDFSPDTEEARLGIRQMIMAALQGQEIVVEVILPFDGENTWLESKHFPVYDAEGEIMGVAASLTNINARKQAEIALLQERQRFQDIVNSVDGVVWEVDFSTFNFTYVSNKAENMLGYALDEWYQPNFWVTHLHPEDKNWAVNFCLTQSTALEPHEFENRFFAKSGEVVWLRDIVTVVEENGKPAYLRGLLIDITEQKRKEKEREDLLSQLENITANIPGVIFQYQNIEGKHTFPFITGRIKELLGYSAAEIQENPAIAFEHIHPEDVSKVINTICSQDADTWQQEYRFQKPDGSWIWIQSASFRKKMPDGNYMWYGYSSDITETRKIQEEIFKLSLVAKRTSNAVVITDRRHRIVWVNEAFTTITGYTLDEVLGKTPRIFHLSETDKDTIERVRVALSKPQAIKFEILNKGKQGQVYWLDIEIQPLYNQQNELTGFMSIETDITKRKKAEEKIKKQNEALKEIAFTESHILRRPVANILGLISLIDIALENKDDWSVIYQYLQYLKQSTLETDAIIHQIVAKTSAIDEEEEI